MSCNAAVMTSHDDIAELALAALDRVAGGETAPAGNATPTQTQGDGGASADFGFGYGRAWCYWHPYRCSK
jgi:hypothetical protein